MIENLRRRMLDEDLKRSRRVVLGGTGAGAAAILAAKGLRMTSAQGATPVASPAPDVTELPAPDMASPMASPAATMQYAYVGSDARSQMVDGTPVADPVGITVYSIDPETGALSLIQTVPSDNAFYFAFDADQTHLYAVNVIGDYNGGTNGSAEAYARDPATGLLTLLNRVDSGGAVSAQPAVSPSGKWLLVANYSGANVTVLPINPDGSLGEVVGEAKREGTGPDTARQDQSRPHAAVFDPAGNFVAVADLGTDNVATYSLNDETGELTLVSEVEAEPGSGPRHLAFNAAGTILYVLTEMGDSIEVYAYDAATGAIGELLQSVSAVPEPFEGTKSGAEIAIHPSGSFLYNSNRGQPDMVTPEGDAIVGWSIDPDTGMLTLIGYTTDEIGQPWSFAFDATGANLYAANYTDSSITQFAIEPGTGALTYTGNRTDVPFPFVIAISAP
ncbi:MAG TPA: lactonase family protein [Thermomicrobiales bacterium]|nr:lactonase family protein [Thermomicrobiales bacterium]